MGDHAYAPTQLELNTRPWDRELEQTAWPAYDTQKEQEQQQQQWQLFPSRRTTLTQGATLLSSFFLQDGRFAAFANETDTAQVDDPRPRKYLEAAHKVVD